MPPHNATAAATHGATPVVTAVLQLRDGRIEAARATLRAVLAQDANQPDALILLSGVTLRSGEVETAAELAHRAVRLAPEEPRAHAAMADVLAHRGDALGAIAAWRQVIAHDPLAAAAHTNLGALLQARRQYNEAWEACDTALSLDPNLAPARLNRGLAAIGLGRFDDAVADLRQAVKALPRQAEAWLGLGLALRRAGRHDEAVTALQRVLKLEPGHVIALNNLGRAHRAAGRYEAAITAFDRALALQPDHVDSRWNRAVAKLLAGRLPEAWDDAEARWQLPGLDPHPSYPRPVWQGEALAGKRLLLVPEQGLGDAIQFARYVPLLAGAGAHVLLGTRPELAGLMASLPGVGQVLAPGDALPDFDCYLPLLSLPRVCATGLESIPAKVPYLVPPPAALRRWEALIPGGEGLAVGLAWAGNPNHVNDANRSMPIAALAPLRDVPGVRFFSLQVGPRAAEAELWPGLNDLSPQLADFTETAAAVARLDLVITVDTAVAHLAGALARPAWLMLAHEPDWRWLAGRTDSPWYPTARLFRQARFNDWASVAHDVAAALATLAADHAAGDALAA